MKFVIYSINYSPELTGIGKYNGELASYLVTKDIDVTVVTAPPYYPEWQRHKGYRNWWSKCVEGGVTLYRSPLYVPRLVTQVTRLLHLSSFALSSAFTLCSLLRQKPDVIMLVQPTLFCAPATLLYCKLTGAKSLMHIQDFEIDAMFALGERRDGIMGRAAAFIERQLIRRFDYVSSICEVMLNKAAQKGVESERIIHFPNWADIDFVGPEVSGDTLRSKWGYSLKDRIVLYAGNLGRKQGLDIVLEAAQAFIANASIKFIIIGEGAYSSTLYEKSREMGLTNVEFKPLQPWSLMPEILSMADVHLVTQRRDAADIVMPSKLTNILSAGGHALVTADPETELGRIAKRYPGIYHCIEPDSKEAFIVGLREYLAVDTRVVNKVAREYAVSYLNQQSITDNFIDCLRKKMS